MSLFRNERFVRVLRPTATVLGLAAAVWHATHTLAMWRQMKEYETTDPAASDFFYGKFQLELGVTIAAFFAGVMAWHLFKPRPKT
jgi:hypothetical protein